MTDPQGRTDVPGFVLAKLGVFIGKTIGGTLDQDVQTLIDGQDMFRDILEDLKKLRMYDLQPMVEKRNTLRAEVEKDVPEGLPRVKAYWNSFICNTEYEFANREALMKVITSACVFFPLIAESMPECKHSIGQSEAIQREIDVLIPKIIELVRKLKADSPVVTKEVLVKHAAEIRSLARECETTETTKSQKAARDEALDNIAKIPEEDRLVTFCKMMIQVTMMINDKDVGFVFLISAIPVLASLLPPEEEADTTTIH